ncbi:Transcription factor [Sesamum angolense]|uniref:Transcription factor n=1 Tax=Sesamum angolense TaxID=2727404 RepID=A0AAE1W6J5_9LAMI|nr:Transcription factor [Sesamum angolense]
MDSEEMGDRVFQHRNSSSILNCPSSVMATTFKYLTMFAGMSICSESMFKPPNGIDPFYSSSGWDPVISEDQSGNFGNSSMNAAKNVEDPQDHCQDSENGVLGASPNGKRKRKFLSMKLATVNPELNVDIERLLSKDILHSRGSNATTLGIGPGLSSSHPFQGLPQGTLNAFPGTAPPFHSLPQNLWNNELQNILQNGFDSNPSVGTLGPNGLSKMEL